jgi:ribosomal protein S27E
LVVSLKEVENMLAWMKCPECKKKFYGVASIYERCPKCGRVIIPTLLTKGEVGIPDYLFERQKKILEEERKNIIERTIREREIAKNRDVCFLMHILLYLLNCFSEHLAI